jgi:hypothetical protein
VGTVLLGACGAKTGLDVPDAQVDAGLDAAIPCVEIPLDGGVIELPLEIPVQVGRADVVFDIDTTASMGQEIEQIRTSLRDRIVPGIQRAIPDAQIGVAIFSDFPEGNCGRASEGDLPFRLVLPVTGDIGRVQSAVQSIFLRNGADEPESQVESLYQIATGEGFGSYVPPSLGCPGGGFGYPCFRRDALPIVLLFTDAPFHNGPGNAFPYDDVNACPFIVPEPHTYEQAVRALNAAGVRVLGLYSGMPGGEGLRHLRQLAVDTGAVSGDAPLVFDIGTRGERLSDSVIEAITTLADVIEFEIVDTELHDVDRTDAVDPRDFVEAVVPVRADPPDGVRAIDVGAGAFLGVRAGTRLVFELRLRNGAMAPGVGPQRFHIEVVFRADRRTRIGSVIVEIVVPGADGSGCPHR